MARQRSQPSSSSAPPPAADNFAAFIGIDWADEQHEVCLLDGARLAREVLPHAPEEIAQWAQQLAVQYGGRPVAICLEQLHGGLAYALQQYPHLVLFPINPAQAHAYRKAFANSGKKDDPTDAELLARYVREHHRHLRTWQPEDEATLALRRFTELRRKLVEERKQTMQKITSVLKLYFPLALLLAKEYSEKLMLALLDEVGTTLREWQRAHPRALKRVLSRFLKNDEKIAELVKWIRAAQPLTSNAAIIQPNALYVRTQLAQLPALDDAIAEFEREIQTLMNAHPDAEIFRSPPGAGEALAPRLLVAFGTDRERFASAYEVECYSGIAPITKQSGKSRHVQSRFACNKFLRQSFHEFADFARKFSSWSKAFYQYKRAHGMQHHAALRALAYKWIRILFRCWKNHTPYDEASYLQQLQRRHVPYLTDPKVA